MSLKDKIINIVLGHPRLVTFGISFGIAFALSMVMGNFGLQQVYARPSLQNLYCSLNPC